ncbi:hypothetical protein [Halomicrococcus sp. NG-SE-24]|uniref:hypothetical protein n=1 Tax=Halomicrococcus sp. NG-SE-24 TaxID=3436928 RepID=UPI003D964469
MRASGLTGVELQVHSRVAPLGRPLAIACLFGGYGAVAMSVVAPNVFNSIFGMVLDAIVLPVAYLVTFVYPAAYAVLALTAAFGVVNDQSSGMSWNNRDRIHVYLAVAFAEWAIHHLLYLLFSLLSEWCK